MADNGTGSALLIGILSFVAGAALSWYVRGEYDGAVVPASVSAELSQDAVDSASAAVVKITAARTATETATERVRTVTRTITVAADCPPGRGPVSSEFDQQLRALAASRSNAGARASGVRGHDQE